MLIEARYFIRMFIKLPLVYHLFTKGISKLFGVSFLFKGKFIYKCAADVLWLVLDLIFNREN